MIAGNLGLFGGVILTFECLKGKSETEQHVKLAKSDVLI